MNILMGMLLTLLLLSSPFLSCVLAAPPTIQRQMEIIEAAIEGIDIATVDPAACYDTASSELLMNMYDTLVFLDGEHMDRYLPQLADNWTLQNITGTTGPDVPPRYFRYTFHIRPNVHFWNGETLTPEDVEYCFERGMVLEPGDNPQWMFYEPLLNTWGALGLNTTALDGNSTEQTRVGAIINHSVESNSTHVWFNLAFPGAYAPFMQILSQQYSSIYSKAWALGLGRVSNWDGNWSDWYNHWLSMRDAPPPFDDPTPAVMGTGPFVLEELNNSLHKWSGLRNHDYWRGWPSNWPSFDSSKPAGYIEHYVVTWAYDWPTRSAMFLNGEIDFCAVPRQYVSQMVSQPGIRCIYPLPSLSVEALFYNFNISRTSPYGPIFEPGVFSESGIPSDFFGNPTWGVHVRKAFSYAIDYDAFIAEMYLGEATRPPTTILPSLPYYDPTLESYTFNLTRAAEEFKQVPGLWETGFTIQIMSNVGSILRPIDVIRDLLELTLEEMNPKFHVSGTWVAWREYLNARLNQQLAALTLGWLADYPDPHNLAYPFYFSQGNFAFYSGYSNARMDGLIQEGIATPDGTERAAIYKQIQQLAIDDCPNIPLDQGFSRHYERDWIVGWYNNPAYSGIYAYSLWKWYYAPLSLSESSVQPLSNSLPVDVNYDGIVNIIDIALVAVAFGSSYGPPLHPRWNFRADMNNDRSVNIVDIANIAMYFGKKSAIWIPS